ncbi:MAG TPA: hypothetical protein VG095_00760 [Chthoniobacterales bacterium]|nr:hypothetical protein [Chthoniobacterales bacterium]
MSFADFLRRGVKLAQKDAEVIFDRDEPIGTATDVVFKRKERRSRGGRGKMGHEQGRPGERPSLSSKP